MFSWRNKEIIIWIVLFSGAMRNALCAGRSKQTLLNYSQLMTSFNYSWLWLFWSSRDSLKYEILVPRCIRFAEPSITIAADFFFFLFHTIKSCHFMWIICLAVASHDNVKTYFLWKKINKRYKMLSATNFAWRFTGLWINKSNNHISQINI